MPASIGLAVGLAPAPVTGVGGLAATHPSYGTVFSLSPEKKRKAEGRERIEGERVGESEGGRERVEAERDGESSVSRERIEAERDGESGGGRERIEGARDGESGGGMEGAIARRVRAVAGLRSGCLLI